MLHPILDTFYCARIFYPYSLPGVQKKREDTYLETICPTRLMKSQRTAKSCFVSSELTSWLAAYDGRPQTPITTLPRFPSLSMTVEKMPLYATQLSTLKAWHPGILQSQKSKRRQHHVHVTPVRLHPHLLTTIHLKTADRSRGHCTYCPSSFVFYGSALS